MYPLSEIIGLDWLEKTYDWETWLKDEPGLFLPFIGNLNGSTVQHISNIKTVPGAGGNQCS